MARNPCASSGVRLPIVEPGKYTTLALRPPTGRRSGREKSPATGAMRSHGNSRDSRPAAWSSATGENIHRHIKARAQRADEQPRLEALAAAVLDQLAAAT